VARQFQLLHPEREIVCNAPTELRGQWDAIRIRQLLNNLLRNALQHGAADSILTVTAKLEDRSAIISVHNEGDPIPPALIGKIFEPLRRSDDQRHGPDSFSMGLGLYIASTIATAHQGALTVASTREQGTIFTAKLPLTRA
jgi:signal transduction histidine kinase